MKQYVLLLILLLHTACSGKPYALSPPKTANQLADKKVYVINHGWHTGFILPIDHLGDKLSPLKARFADARYLEFGWGEKEFYQAPEITVWLIIRAISWPHDTVMYVQALSVPPSEFYAASGVKELCLTDSQFETLTDYISNSFQYDASGSLMPVGATLNPDRQFYEGEGDYYLLNTCNKWTAKGLQSAGMDIWPSFKLTAVSVTDAIKSQSRDMPLRCR